MKCKFSAMMAGVLGFAVLATSNLVLAQEQGGRRGPGGPGGNRPGAGQQFGGGFRAGGGAGDSFGLLRIEQVQKELKLSEDQISKIQELAQSSQPRFGGRDGDQDQGSREQQMQRAIERRAEARKQLASILDDAQNKRLLGITIQTQGATALTNPEVAEQLGLSEDQLTQIREARSRSFSGFGQGERPSREEMESRTQAANDKALAVLSDEQKAKFEALKGEKFELDRSQLRGPGGQREGQRGPGGPGGQRGGERRGGNRT